MSKRRLMRWLMLSSVILSSCALPGPDVSAVAAPAVMCVRIPEPPPFAADVHVSIVDGDFIDADDGGIQLLRDYAATRQAIIKAWRN